MKKSSQFERFMKELDQDPRLKRVLYKVKRRHKKETDKIENVTDLVLLSLAIVSRFVSRKKARTIDEFMDIVFLLVQVSLLLKENVFDRPEVKEFFNQGSKRILSVAREYVDLALSKVDDLKGLKFRKT